MLALFHIYIFFLFLFSVGFTFECVYWLLQLKLYIVKSLHIIRTLIRKQAIVKGVEESNTYASCA